MEATHFPNEPAHTGLTILDIALEKKGGKKEKNSYCNTGYSYLVTHPSTNLAEQGLTLLNGR